MNRQIIKVPIYINSWDCLNRRLAESRLKIFDLDSAKKIVKVSDKFERFESFSVKPTYKFMLYTEKDDFQKPIFVTYKQIQKLPSTYYLLMVENIQHQYPVLRFISIKNIKFELIKADIKVPKLIFDNTYRVINSDGVVL